MGRPDRPRRRARRAPAAARHRAPAPELLRRGVPAAHPPTRPRPLGRLTLSRRLRRHGSGGRLSAPTASCRHGGRSCRPGCAAPRQPRLGRKPAPRRCVWRSGAARPGLAAAALVPSSSRRRTRSSLSASLGRSHRMSPAVPLSAGGEGLGEGRRSHPCSSGWPRWPGCPGWHRGTCRGTGAVR